jgi:hypothetical protein
MPVKRTRGPDRFPNRNRKPRKPRVRSIAKAVAQVAALTTAVGDLIDKHTGAPNGERIIEALALLATGSPEQVRKFFGLTRWQRLRPQDRQAALVVLEQRRFGKVAQADEGPVEHAPTTIVNVFSTAAEYEFVTQAQPKQVGSSRTLEAKDDDPKR